MPTTQPREQSPTPTDAALPAWPGAARIAVWVALHLQFAPSFHAGLDDYGHRAGFWRLMDVLDRHGIRASVSLHMRDAAHCPDMLEACVNRSWELLACAAPAPGDGAQSELAVEDIRRACDVLHERSGKPLAGWLAHDAGLDADSLGHLAGAGLSYVANLRCLDGPTKRASASGLLVELPYCEEASDLRCLVQQRMAPGRYAELILAQFEQLYAEGAHATRALGLTVHPAVLGAPHNLPAFEAALAEIAGRDKVWIATGREIAHWVAHGCHEADMPAASGGNP